jgi:hypothetical protein
VIFSAKVVTTMKNDKGFWLLWVCGFFFGVGVVSMILSLSPQTFDLKPIGEDCPRCERCEVCEDCADLLQDVIDEHKKENECGPFIILGRGGYENLREMLKYNGFWYTEDQSGRDDNAE